MSARMVRHERNKSSVQNNKKDSMGCILYFYDVVLEADTMRLKVLVKD
jgi:hypothetical protein